MPSASHSSAFGLASFSDDSGACGASWLGLLALFTFQLGSVPAWTLPSPLFRMFPWPGPLAFLIFDKVSKSGVTKELAAQKHRFGSVNSPEIEVIPTEVGVHKPY